MTRTEFDNQLRAMKAKRDEALRYVRNLQQELKEKIAAKNRIIYELGTDVKNMKYQLHLLGVEHERINNEWGGKIRAFIEEYESHTTSNLAEAETLNIMYELRRRGFSGMISKPCPEAENGLEAYDLNKTFIAPSECEAMSTT